MGTLKVEERERLELRLECESEDMQNEFAILAAKTMLSLSELNVPPVKKLKFLIENSKFYRKVYEAIENVDDFNSVMSCLSDYWSFFDYQLLELIIRTFCGNLTDKLEEYEGKFKEFCQRRLCEVPKGALGVRAENGDALYLKIDDNFSYKKTKVLDVKKLEYRLSKLLDTELVLLRIDEGCLELIFICLSDMPELNSLLKQQLKQLGIIYM